MNIDSDYKRLYLILTDKPIALRLLYQGIVNHIHESYIAADKTRFRKKYANRDNSIYKIYVSA